MPIAIAIGTLLAASVAGAGGLEERKAPEDRARADRDPIVQRAHDAERERTRRKIEERKSPEAKKRRRDSRNAYKDLTSSDALDLVRAKFDSFVNEPLWRLPELGDDRILKYRSDTSALLDLGGGRKGLLLSSDPLRSDHGGDSAPVDLAIEHSGSDFAPKHPSVDSRLGGSARRGFQLTRSGLGLVPVVDRDAPATRVKDKLFYGNALDGDADLLAAPTARGFQVFAQLRSASSPSAIEFDITAPAGAEASLTGSDASPDTRGVVVTKGDEPVGEIAAPMARDADGQNVPVRYKLDGRRLTVEVDHRDGDFEYPIMVDPSVTENFLSWRHNGAIDFDRWEFKYVGWGFWGQGGWRPNGDVPDWGRGLYLWGQNNLWYNWGFSGEFVWGAPRRSRIFRADYMHTFHRWIWDCTEQGVWGPNRPGGANWDGPFMYNGQQVYSRYHCGELNNDAYTLCPTMNPCADSAGSPGNYLVFKLREDYGDGARSPAPAAYLGGVAISLTDDENPVFDLTGESGFPDPNVWQDDGTFRMEPVTRDEGLGMMRYDWIVPGRNTETRVHPCQGSARCPHQWKNPDPAIPAYNSAFTGRILDMPNGQQRVTLRAYDALDKTVAVDRDIKVDHVKPRVDSYSGILWDDRVDSDPEDGGALYRWPANLNVRAADDHSGVKSVQLLVDNQQVDPSHLKTNSCSATGCPTTLDASFQLNRHGLSTGFHTVTIKVKDELADRADASRHVDTSKSWQIYVPERVLEMEDSDIVSASSTTPPPEDTSIPPDSPDSATCPPDPDFTDPLYCKPDTTSPTYTEISGEPAVDVADPDPLHDSRVAQWRLGELTGTLARDSKGANHGTYLDPANYTLGQKGSMADGDKALKLNGGTAHVSVPPASFEHARNASFSVELWYTPPNPTELVPLFSADTVGYDKGDFYLFATATGQVQVGYFGEDMYTAADTLTPGQTAHIVATYDKASDTSRIYVNGVEKAASNIGPINGTAAMSPKIGGWVATPWWADYYGKGTYDEVSVYNRALTGAEVTQRNALTSSTGGTVNAQSATPLSGNCSAPGDPITGTPPTVKRRYALSDQNGFNGDKTFNDPQAAALQAQTARVILPYDLVRKAAAGSPNYCNWYQNVYEWIQHLKAKRMQPLVSFEFSYTVYDPSRPVSRSKYRSDIRRFMEKFPYVDHYTAWNEPNHPKHFKQYTDGKLAGQMWTDAVEMCKRYGGNCQVGAGDFSDKTRYLPSQYLTEYRQGMGDQLPAFWAYHTYYMLNRPASSPVDTLTRFLSWGPVQRRKVVWITEAGSYRHTTSKTYTEQEQADTLTRFFNTPVYKNNADQNSDPIKRFYYYFWHAAQPQPQQGEDAGLVEWDQSCYRKVYPVYLKKATGQTAVQPGRPACP